MGLSDLFQRNAYHPVAGRGITATFRVAATTTTFYCLNIISRLFDKFLLHDILSYLKTLFSINKKINYIFIIFSKIGEGFHTKW